MKTDEEIIWDLVRWGHFENPYGEARTIDANKLLREGRLTMDNPAVRDAVESYQDYFAVTMEPLIAKHYPSRMSAAVKVDGEVGPAMREFFTMERCNVPDYGYEVQAAVGTGNWKRCHGIGEFHCATVRFKNDPPSFLRPVIDEVWENVVEANKAMGLYFKRDDSLQKADIDISFVNPRTVNPPNLRGGWIGLAIVGNGVRCGHMIWQLYSTAYRPTNLINAWSLLMIHEAGHNMGLQHTRGGIMNPYILPTLKPTWKGDPSERIIRSLYGGEPVPTGEPEKKRMVLAWQRGNNFEVIQEVPTSSGGSFWPN